MDAFFIVFKVKTAESEVKTVRLVAAMTVSTALLGLSSYYATVFLFGLIQRNPMLELTMLLMGTLNGTVAGYSSSLIWNKHLKNFEF